MAQKRRIFYQVGKKRLNDKNQTVQNCPKTTSYGNFLLIELIYGNHPMAKKINRQVSLDLVEPHEWTQVEKDLVERAKSAAEKAYAPYSNFLVGASVLLENGIVLAGNNQENVSFPVGVCAERALLSFAMGNYPGVRPLKLAIAARKREAGGFSFVTPCGSCRQTINEYEMLFGAPIEILMLHEDGQMLRASSIQELLPFSFNSF
jgi:cytidine deaminase